MADPHFNERQLFETVEINGEKLKIPAILPKFSRTAGETRWPGAALGSSNTEVFEELLQLNDLQLQELREQGVIN